MMQFMENVVIITAFSVIVIAFIALIVIGVLESYDAITSVNGFYIRHNDHSPRKVPS